MKKLTEPLLRHHLAETILRARGCAAGIVKPVFRLIFTGRLALDSGSGVCIDRQHLKLRKVRYVDRETVQNSQLRASSSQYRIPNPAIRGQNIDSQNSAVAKVNVAYENRRGVVNGTHC